MLLISFDRTSIAQSTGIALLTAGALALLALVSTYWTWQWLAPLPEARTPTSVSVNGNPASAKDLFGNPERKRSNASAKVGAISLLGIVAASAGRRGYAVMRLDPREILAIREGEEIIPGIRLAEVNTDHVVLERGGSRETLAWAEKNATAELALPRLGK